MKTAIEFLKLILIIIALVWLCSCGNRKQYVIDLIHQYGDSIGISRNKLHAIQFAEDEIRRQYQERNEPKFFGTTTAELKLRQEFLRRERAEYKVMLDELRRHNSRTLKQRIKFKSDIDRFQEKIDSLKLELYK